MQGIHPETGVPTRWSLKPADTLGLIFWTREPTALIRDRELLRPYDVKIHMTVTGWHEVERGAPSLEQGAHLLRKVTEVYGTHNVTWRFSPIPLVNDVVQRFSQIARVAHRAGLKSAYVSFLQENDRVPETRTVEERRDLLNQISKISGFFFDLDVRLCNEDRLLAGVKTGPNLCSAVCAPPEVYALPGQGKPASEGCGCVFMVDPFTINESCQFFCTYCYASYKDSSPHKRNTIKLPQVSK